MKFYLNNKYPGHRSIRQRMALLEYCVDTNVRFFSEKGFETSSHISKIYYSEVSDMHIAIGVPGPILPSKLWFGLDYKERPKKATLWFKEEENCIFIHCFLTFHKEGQ
jgi:hypothetical protein